MKVIAAQAFKYAHDGFTVRDIAEGAEVEIQDELFEGMKADGLVEEAPAEAKKKGKGGKAAAETPPVEDAAQEAPPADAEPAAPAAEA